MPPEKHALLSASSASRWLKCTAAPRFEEHLPDYAGAQALSIGSLEKPETVAHRLFNVLRQMDEEGVEALTCEVLPAEGIGLAIMNRLSRAAAFRIRNADEEADLQAAPIAEADG